MEEEKVYRKVGRKYIPIGVCEPINWLPNGIWFVHSCNNSHGRTSMSWLNELYNGFTKLFDVPKPSFEQIAEMEQYTDAVTKVLQQYKGDVLIYNKCYADVAREIVKAMCDITNKAKKL